MRVNRLHRQTGITLIEVVVFIVIAGILASDGIIPPLAGAWIATVIFAVVGVMMFSFAKN